MNFKELHVHGQIHLRKWASLIDPIQRWPTSRTTGYYYVVLDIYAKDVLQEK